VSSPCFARKILMCGKLLLCRIQKLLLCRIQAEGAEQEEEMSSGGLGPSSPPVHQDQEGLPARPPHRVCWNQWSTVSQYWITQTDMQLLSP